MMQVLKTAVEQVGVRIIDPKTKQVREKKFMTILLACLRRYFFNDNLIRIKSQKFYREFCM